MDPLAVSRQLIDFIKSSPSCFHAAAAIARTLEHAGFAELNETESWTIEKNSAYFVMRNNSSIIAFRTGSGTAHFHFQIAAAHSDSPGFKVKQIPELKGPGNMLCLNVEGYGGMIDSTWLDRPLSLAGRILVKDGQSIESRLIFFEKPMLIIPNVAIHFNRNVNSGYDYNHQTDLIPLFSTGDCAVGDLTSALAERTGCHSEDILARDLFLVNMTEPCIWGLKDEFVSSPKLDDLQCAFSATEAMTQKTDCSGINVLAVFDNEETGSVTKQGASGTFLADTLKRITLSLGHTEQDYYRACAGSFLVSCDNAHAVHPTHPEKTDAENRVFMNKGIVIKENANQKYTSDAVSKAVFSTICAKAGIPVQYFANRSDIAGGSTLGNLSNEQVSMNAVDIGAAQLAMHSSYETCGSHDTAYLIQALTAFYNSDITIRDRNTVTL